MTKLITLATMLFAGLGWLFLAAWGEGGLAAFFANPARTSVIVVTFLLMAVGAFSEGNLSRGEHEDRGNRWVLWTVLVIGLLDGWLPAYCDRTGFLTFGGDGVRWTGVALYTAGQSCACGRSLCWDRGSRAW